MKKFISLLLSAVLIATIFTTIPFTASAAETDSEYTGDGMLGNIGDCEWILDFTNQMLTIKPIDPENTNASTGDFSSDNLAPWYEKRGTVYIIKIEDGVSNLGDYLFYDLHNVQRIEIPDSVKTIGAHAFEKCESLSVIKGGNGISSVGDYAFIDTDLSCFRANVPFCTLGTASVGFDSGRPSPLPKSGFLIYGYSNSRAQTYANNNGFTFINMSGEQYDVYNELGYVYNTLTFDRVTKAWEGEKLRAVAQLPQYTNCDGLYVKDHDEIALDADGNFTMPGFGITITGRTWESYPCTIDLSDGSDAVYGGMVAQVYSMVGPYFHVIETYNTHGSLYPAYDLDLNGDRGADVHMKYNQSTTGVEFSVLDSNSVMHSVGYQPKNMEYSPITFVFAESKIDTATLYLNLPRAGSENVLETVWDNIRPADQSEPYRIENIYWYDEWGIMTTPIQGGKYYFADFELVPNEGYAFSLDSDIKVIDDYTYTYKASRMYDDGRIYVSTSNYLIKGETPHSIIINGGIASTEDDDYNGAHQITSAKAGDWVYALPYTRELGERGYFELYSPTYDTNGMDDLTVGIDGGFVMLDEDVEIDVNYELKQQRDFSLDLYNGDVTLSRDYPVLGGYYSCDYFGVVSVLARETNQSSEYDHQTDRILYYYDVDKDGTNDILCTIDSDADNAVFSLLAGNSISNRNIVTLTLDRDESAYCPIRTLIIQLQTPPNRSITVYNGFATLDPADNAGEHAVTEAAPGTEVYLMPDLDDVEDGYYIPMGSRKGESDDVDIYLGEGDECYFTMPNWDVTTTLTYETEEQMDSVLDLYNGAVTIPGDNNQKSEVFGVMRLLYYKAAAYESVGSGAAVFDIDGDRTWDIRLSNGNTYTLLDTSSLTENVTLSFSRVEGIRYPVRSVAIQAVKPAKCKITVNGGGVASSVDDDFANEHIITEAETGDRVYIVTKASEIDDDSYIMQGSMEATSDDVAIADCSFIMPAKDVTVDFEFTSYVQDDIIFDFRVNKSTVLNNNVPTQCSEAYGTRMLLNLMSANRVDADDNKTNYDIDGDGSFDIQVEPITRTSYGFVLLDTHSLVPNAANGTDYLMTLTREQSWTLPIRSLRIVLIDNTAPPKRGDINRNGVIDIDDATTLQRYFAEFLNPDGTPIIDFDDPINLSVCDANNDGKINIRDVTQIQRYLAGFVELMP